MLLIQCVEYKATIGMNKTFKRPTELIQGNKNKLADAASPYREKMPKTAKNKYWKSARRPHIQVQKVQKNMIEFNKQNCKKISNMNQLNKIQQIPDYGYGKFEIHQKTRLNKSGVERGDNFIIFKRNQNKRRRFNETTQYKKGNIRTLSCVGIEKPKIQNPNQDLVDLRQAKRQSATPHNGRSLSV